MWNVKVPSNHKHVWLAEKITQVSIYQFIVIEIIFQVQKFIDITEFQHK